MAFLLRLIALSLASSACLAADEAQLSQHRERLKQKWEAQFRAADANGDRLLSRDEIGSGGLPDSLEKHFDQIDVNHDKTLSPEELWEVHEARLRAQRRASGPPR